MVEKFQQAGLTLRKFSGVGSTLRTRGGGSTLRSRGGGEVAPSTFYAESESEVRTSKSLKEKFFPIFCPRTRSLYTTHILTQMVLSSAKLAVQLEKKTVIDERSFGLGCPTNVSVVRFLRVGTKLEYWDKPKNFG